MSRFVGATEELTIGAVAERSGLAVSALRFYEDKGLITAERTEGGQRRYHRDVLRRLAFIGVAQRVGLRLEEIGAALAELPENASPMGEEWARLSASWRPMLDERIRLLEGLRDDLDSCIGCGCLSLDRCALYNPDDRARAFGAGPRYLLGDPSLDPDS
ncbi:MAG: redox-sensitive transcriptional activator SoxR [Acidimicrobiales bacterium]|nr:redox-sensitive transcriptional activator SoxR [Acidimicrobiales bacterium]